MILQIFRAKPGNPRVGGRGEGEGRKDMVQVHNREPERRLVTS